MITNVPEQGAGQPARTRSSTASALVVWAAWLTMTVAAILFIRHHARNIPYMDDFSLVPIMTGNARVDFDWVWMQHNEHRPVLSRLILAGAYRFLWNDFRTGMYINAAVMSMAAASTLLLARRVRGHWSLTDGAIPIAMLSLGQAEVFLIGFALNLVLSTWIAVELIAIIDQAGRCPGWRPTLRFGACLVLLPLTGGSGLVLLPPLTLWLSGYVLLGWWSGRRPGSAAKVIGLLSIAACTAIVALYLHGYSRPVHHPTAPSLGASARTTMEYLSLVVMRTRDHWEAMALFVVVLTGATLVRLTVVVVRTPGERIRASGLIALLFAQLGGAVAVGISRSGFGPHMGLTSRYVTAAAPLFAALYIARLAYGPPRTRRVIHISLLVLVCLAVPNNTTLGLKMGGKRYRQNLQVERGLQARVPASEIMEKVSPALYPDAGEAYTGLKMLKDAGFGEFKHFNDDRIATAPHAVSVIR